MFKIIFIFAVLLIAQPQLAASTELDLSGSEANAPDLSVRQDGTDMPSMTPPACPCICYLGTGKRRRAAMVCGRERFGASSCAVQTCFTKGEKGASCCEDEAPVPTMSLCPCRCFPGVPGRRRAHRQCRKLEGMCAVSRCSRKRKRRFQCCDI